MPSPKTWGKHFWYTIHIAALGYPENPTVEQRNTYRAFYTNFGNILPCKKCAANYTKHMQEIPIGQALQNRHSLFAWTVDLHNIVNTHTGKPIWTREYAEAFYMSESFNECPKYDQETTTDAWRLLLILMIIVNLIAIAVIVYKFL